MPIDNSAELERIQRLKYMVFEEAWRKLEALQDQEDALRHPRRGGLVVIDNIKDRRGGKR